MTSFVDQCLLQLRQATAIADLLKGGSAAPFPHLERLITSVFRLDGASIDSIADVSVADIDPMVLFTPQDRITGSLTQTQPSYELTDLRADIATSHSPQWAHLLAHAELHLVAELDPGGIESAATHTIENIQSFADFQSRFRYIDLDAFLAAHKITTVEQLRDAAEYVLTEVRLKAPPAFDPGDPANAHDVALDLALVIVEELDLSVGLQSAQLLRAAADRSSPGASSAVFGPAVNPFAVAVVFPGASVDAPSANAIDELFALAEVLPLFANPP